MIELEPEPLGGAASLLVAFGVRHPFKVCLTVLPKGSKVLYHRVFRVSILGIVSMVFG